MRRSCLAVLVAAALTACGGSSNTSDPVAACKSVFSTVCNKLFQCNPSGAAQIYGSASACASNLSSGCTATNASCPSGTSYNAGNASTCINDYSNESCTDVTGGVTPASCNKVCQ
ncbi:MAG TPA: hypothetical protein VMT11_13425 [Myxococcaceae bacterium]|nr:hypothetical protein [Myxococcaceae bacterium]